MRLSGDDNDERGQTGDREQEISLSILHLIYDNHRVCVRSETFLKAI